MEPLFRSEEDYASFCATVRISYHVKTAPLGSYSGNCYLGIDAGSTTTKAAARRRGRFFAVFVSTATTTEARWRTAIRAVQDIYSKLPSTARISYSCSTGYGEALIKAALMLDEGEVETVSHYYAAAFFDPEVDCILDIGGQDMKCIKIKNGTVDSVQLNEACSSGCGSFIETFREIIELCSVQDFAKELLCLPKHPIDLGTRCTVFMNSKVKQAQKEGATVADISAGLAYSVIKNALYKVIKVSDATELGRNISSYRAVLSTTTLFCAALNELQAVRRFARTSPESWAHSAPPSIARERYKEGMETTMLSIDTHQCAALSRPQWQNARAVQTSCRLTINRFSGGRQFISGNRCERGIGKEQQQRPRAEPV